MSGSVVLGSGVSPPFPPPSVAWRATIILSLLYWLSILDRFIIALMVDPIKHDLNITDLQFGIMQGLAFTITFSAFGVLAGALADRCNRRMVVCRSRCVVVGLKPSLEPRVNPCLARTLSC